MLTLSFRHDNQEDEKRILTPLGKLQADYTGKRLAEMMKGAEEGFGPCKVKALRVFNMTRAKETAEIIASHLPGVTFLNPDPNLNEGRYVGLRTRFVTTKSAPRTNNASLTHRSPTDLATTFPIAFGTG